MSGRYDPGGLACQRMSKADQGLHERVLAWARFDNEGLRASFAHLFGRAPVPRNMSTKKAQSGLQLLFSFARKGTVGKRMSGCVVGACAYDWPECVMDGC
jgi:hypothetical protein